MAVLALLVALGPVACAGSPNASARALGSSLGGVSLGMTETQVLNARGTPDARGVTGGLGTPQWEYDEGLVVFLHLADPGAGAMTVWRLLARPPFDGATVEGFRLGDSMDTFRQKYAAHGVTAPDPTQLFVRDRRGAVLSATFRSGGASEMTLQAP